MFLEITSTVLALAAFLGLLIFVPVAKTRLFNRWQLAAEQEGHRLAMQELQRALETVDGAQLAVVQRVLTESRQGVRAVVRWDATGAEQELWFAKAWPKDGDLLAIAGADLSTGQLELRNIVARAAAAPVAGS